jgi:DNA-binding response OmpR family regulator
LQAVWQLLRVTKYWHKFCLVAAMKILVVESELKDYLYNCALLQELGHECLPHNPADDSVMALNSFWPDAILTNIFLDTITALDLCVEVKKQFGELPPTIIHSPAKEHSFLASRFPDYVFVTSPLTTANLRAAFEKVMPKKTTETMPVSKTG